MMTLSVWHWLVLMLFLVLPAWLFSRIVVKAGFPAWYAVLGLVPVVNVIALWLFAYARWPNDE